MLESYCRSLNGSICFCVSIYRYDFWADASIRDITNKKHVFFLVSWVLPYWWLSRMTQMTDEEQKKTVTLLVYGSITAVSLLLTVVSSYCFYLAALRASENLHNEMTKAVLRAPVLFFDTNPTGRILNRFSKDIRNMDDFLPGQFLFAVQLCQHSFDNLLCLPYKIFSEVITRDQEAGGDYKQSSVFTSCWYCGRSGSDSLLRNGRCLPEEVLSVSNSYKHFCVLSKMDHVLVCITSFGQNCAKKL